MLVITMDVPMCAHTIHYSLSYIVAPNRTNCMGCSDYLYLKSNTHHFANFLFSWTGMAWHRVVRLNKIKFLICLNKIYFSKSEVLM